MGWGNWLSLCLVQPRLDRGRLYCKNEPGCEMRDLWFRMNALRLANEDLTSALSARKKSVSQIVQGGNGASSFFRQDRTPVFGSSKPA